LNSMISGAVAGLVCEYVSTIIAPIQTTNKFNITFRLPQGVFLSVILPTSLGFMVYEYEKNYNRTGSQFYTICYNYLYFLHG
jgi:hypothetical protein